jgi:glucose/arabinose dehydrogenase
MKTQRTIRLVSLAALLMLLSAPVFAQSLSEPGWTYTTLTTPGLSQPTGMRFLGPDDFFAIEKASGKVKRFQAGSATEVLDLPVNATSERGLLGIELHPDFPTTPSVYVYYSLADGGDGGAWLENRLSRFTWDGSSLTSENVLLSIPQDPNMNNGPNHDGGPIVFGPDGMLYGVLGDLNRNRAEQNFENMADTSSLAGGVYRLRDDGAIPDGSMGGEDANPFYDHATQGFRKFFAYGVRNSFGVAFDPATGALWDTENGPAGYDEINLVAEGFNSGWEDVMGPADPGDTDTLVELPGSHYSDPEFSFEAAIGITSIQFLYETVLGPDYDDGVLVGDNNTQSLYLFRLNDARDGFDLDGALADLVANSTAERESLRVGVDFGVITDIQVGPDDAVYVTSLSNGEVYRIVPEPMTVLLLSAGLGLVVRRRR